MIRAGKNIRDTRPLKEDLYRAFPESFISAVFGAVSSVAWPGSILHAADGIRKGYVKDLSSFSSITGFLIGYSATTYFWGKFLVENSHHPEAWIPVVTNIVSGVAEYAYRKGKANTKGDNGLELKVSKSA